MDRETVFLLRRASEESRKAISSDRPEAADAHQGLAILYSVKAAEALAELPTTAEAEPQG